MGGGQCENKNGKLLKSVMDDCKELGVFGSQMEGINYEDVSSIDVAIAQVGEELNEEIDNWYQNRRGWVNDRVKDGIAERKVRI